MAEDAGSLKERRLDQLHAGDDGVLILARVVSAERRDVVRRSDGGRRPVLTGLLTDRRATVRFTWWDPPASGQLEPGVVFRAGPVSVRDFRGRLELSFNWKTRFAEASDAELPEVSVAELPSRTIRQLRAGDEGFRIDVRIVRLAAKTVTMADGPRSIWEGLVGDGSGTCAFTAWAALPLAAGNPVRLSGVRVSRFRDRPQLELDERSRCDPLPEPWVPTLDQLLVPAPRRLGELEEDGGGALVTVVGRVVGLAPPSGLVRRCPECRRTVAAGKCPMHGTVAAVADLRARVILDDGTGTATINLGREATEAEWGHPLDEALARESRGVGGEVEDELIGRMIGRTRWATGSASADDFGLTVYPETWGASAPAPPVRGRRSP